jgi:hypothetical protein
MWVEAILAPDDVRALFAALLPVTIRLGERGELALEPPHTITLVEGRGIHVTCRARLRWMVLGVRVPITIHSLNALVLPSIERRDGADILVFRVDVEHADVALLPDLVDDEVTRVVNAELAKKRIDLEWRFSDTLSHVFAMPRALEEIESLGLVVQWGRVKVTTKGLVLAVSFEAVVARRDGPHTDGASTKRADLAGPASASRAAPVVVAARSPSYGVIAGALAVAAAFGFAVSRALSPRRGPLETWLWR